MTILKLKDLISDNSLSYFPEDSLIIDVNLLAPSQTLTKFYFYTKVFYISLVVFLYLLITFSHSDLDNFNNSNEPMQSANNSINKLIREYGYLLVMIGSFKTVDMQLESSRLQYETAKLNSVTLAERTAYENAKASRKRADEELSGILGVSDAVKNRLTQIKTRNNNMEIGLTDFWNTREQLIRDLLAKRNETDPVKKALLDQSYDYSSIKIIRLIKEQREDINKSLFDLNQILDLIIAASEGSGGNSEQSEVNNNLNQLAKPEDSKALVTDVKKSSIVDFDSINQWIEDLSLIKRIAFAMLLGNTLIVSIVVNILFIYFGDNFLKKYNLETRFPRIKGVLEYRKKFQRFYILNGIFIIFLTTSYSIAFAIRILFF